MTQKGPFQVNVSTSSKTGQESVELQNKEHFTTNTDCNDQTTLILARLLFDKLFIISKLFSGNLQLQL